MRRILTTTIASSLLALALPVAASAQHRSAHRRHHQRAHTVVFTPAGSKTVVTTAPTTPMPTEPPSGESAGKIVSYEGGVLKITLADGTTVSGKVTESTEIQCAGAASPSGSSAQGDEHGSGLAASHGDGEHGGQVSEGDENSQGGEQGDDEGGQVEGAPSCGVSSLVKEAKVAEAELHVSSAGAVWEKIALA
jgi:hypothetical protein